MQGRTQGRSGASCRHGDADVPGMLNPQGMASATGTAAGNAHGAAASDPDRSGWIDGLRALCALTVVLWHGIAGIAGMPRAVVERSALFANLAVEMFFVISGYLITASLLRRALPGGGLAAYRRFLIARSVRILPTAFAGLTAFYVVAGWLGPSFSAGDCLVYATFQSHWYEASHGGGSVVGPGQYWSLSIEEHFYLLWPLLLALAGGLRARPWALLLGALALGLATRALLLAVGWDPFYFFLARLDGLAAGAVLALVGIARVAGGLRAQHLLVGLPAILAGALLWLHFSGSAERVIQLVKYPLVAGACLALFLVAARLGLLRTALSWPWLVGVGRRSYAIYVIHALCLPLAGAATHALAGGAGAYASAAIFLTSYLVLTALLAQLLYLAVEAPTTRWAQRWR
jgi:peptidoglycan/LPS O-acetylase OafA/YrhL